MRLARLKRRSRNKIPLDAGRLQRNAAKASRDAFDMSTLILTNAQLVLPDEIRRGTLVVENQTIKAISDGSSGAVGAIDCQGDFIIPGLIELHTDNLERHLQPRPKVDWPHTAAILAHDAELASVGITTVFDAVRLGSLVGDANAAYDRYARKLVTELLQIRERGVLKCSHFLHLRAEICSESLLEELREFGPEDRVRILSVMDHTPGQRQFRDREKFKHYLQGKFGLTEAEFDSHVVYRTDLSARVGAVHEAAAIAAAQGLGAVLASHDDTTVAQVAHSASQGIKVAEFATTVEAAKACRQHGLSIVMGAPNLIRGASHSGNVAAAELAELDLLDILSSDYAPSALLTSAFMLGDMWGSLAKGIATVTRNPAMATGLADRGRLETGLSADLLRVRCLGTTPFVVGAWSKGRQIA